MPSSRESSVWRTLAVAFGDGLAFGVALTLTNNAARIATGKAAPPQPDIRPLADRITDVEQRIERSRFAGSLPAPAVAAPLESKLSEAVLVAIDARFGIISGQIDRRLAELDAKIKGELEALGAQDRSLAEATEARVDSEIRLLRGQMVELHREFAETLARLVDEQIEQTVNRRIEALQEQLRETIREDSLKTNAGLEALIESRFQAFREEMGGKDRQIEDLRTRVEGQDRNLLELVVTLGESCLRAAERISPSHASPNGPPPTSAADGDLPAFAQAEQQRKALWSVPIVSSFLIATTGVLAFHYLVA